MDLVHTVTTAIGTDAYDGTGEVESWRPVDGSYALESGQSSIGRTADINAVTVGTTSGTLRLSYFIGTKSFLSSQIRVHSGSTAAGATPTLVKLALFTVDSSGNLTRVAVTANDLTLLAAANTAYNKSWTTAYQMKIGQLYAAGLLVITAAAVPTMVGHAMVFFTDNLVFPPIAGSVADTDIAASYAAGSIGVSAQRAYHAILP